MSPVTCDETEITSDIIHEDTCRDAAVTEGSQQRAVQTKESHS